MHTFLKVEPSQLTQLNQPSQSETIIGSSKNTQQSDNIDHLLERINQGEKLEFRCFQVTQGIISSNIVSNKTLKIELNGEITVFECDLKSEEQVIKPKLKISFNNIL